MRAERPCRPGACDQSGRSSSAFPGARRVALTPRSTRHLRRRSIRVASPAGGFEAAPIGRASEHGRRCEHAAGGARNGSRDIRAAARARLRRRPAHPARWTRQRSPSRDASPPEHLRRRRRVDAAEGPAMFAARCRSASPRPRERVYHPPRCLGACRWSCSRAGLRHAVVRSRRRACRHRRPRLRSPRAPC